MSISGIRTAIATSLASITSLTVNPYIPTDVQPPCVDISLKRSNPIEFHKVGGAYGDILIKFDVTVMATLADRVDAQEKLDAYFMQGGTSSIMTAIEASDLSGVAQTIFCKGISTYGGLKFNTTDYLGAVFDVEVWATQL